MDKTKTLTKQVLDIVVNKGTELPSSGYYDQFAEQGTYLCRRCGLALFRSDHKFLSSCGWPSFDDELPNAIKRQPDPDQQRVEIVCHRCQAHLGHVFEGEQLTLRNLRYCVNALSIDFVRNTDVVDSCEAIYAGGCFWGVQYYLDQQEGVLATEVGYTGGRLDNPDYEHVCQSHTGHVEAVRVLYDPNRVSYTTLTKFFFEIHDPTQADGQGPHIGSQYHSAIFYLDADQKSIAYQLMATLENQGLNIVTKILPATVFWSAEQYHQHYYQRVDKKPYCHSRIKRFIDHTNGK